MQKHERVLMLSYTYISRVVRIC